MPKIRGLVSIHFCIILDRDTSERVIANPPREMIFSRKVSSVRTQPILIHTRGSQEIEKSNYSKLNIRMRFRKSKKKKKSVIV